MITNCLAVDVGKSSSFFALYQSSDISAGSESLTTLIKPKKLEPKRSVLTALLQEVKAVLKDDKFVVAMESTGIYHSPIERFFKDEGIDVIVLNPLLTGKSAIDGLRKTKTDIKDTRKIALLVFRGAYNQQRTVSKLEAYRRDFSRILEERKSTLVNLKNRLKNYLFKAAPSYEKVAKHRNIFSSGILALIAKYPHAEKIAAGHLKPMRNLMNKATNNKHQQSNEEFIKQLKESSKDDIPTIDADSQICEEITYLASEIKRLSNSLEALQSKFNNSCKEDKLHATLTGIEGIGDTMASHIIAELGDISRFTTRGKLQAYAGLDPARMQSSKSLNTNGSIVKRGNRHLRKWLVLTAKLLIMHKDSGNVAANIEAYYRTKKGTKENGGSTHHHLYALIAATNKLIRIIFGKAQALMNA